jgi:MtrB/PioB family decaheme-associated outer membrane protein
MTKMTNTPAMRPLVVALRAALAAAPLLALSAHAADLTLADLTQPISTVEVGVGYNSSASAKAAEYNGVTDKGAFLIGNMDLRGGGAYDSDDAWRWRVIARDLGLGDRSADAQFGRQGTFRVDLMANEILRQRSDTYQTPYIGAGTNVLTLPSNWLTLLVPRVSAVAPAVGAGGGTNARGLSPDVTNSSALVAGVLTPPTAAQIAQAAAIQAADLPAFQQFSLQTKRSQYGLGITYEIDRAWQVTASYSHEDKTGTKPLGTVTRYTNGDLSATIPDQIDQTHQQFNAGLTYLGEKLTFNAAFYSSVFTNNVSSMSWSNWAVPGNSQTMSSAPSNSFHQISFTGTYAMSPSTKFSANYAYGRAEQNDAFLTDVSTPVVPRASLAGLVVTQALNLKAIHRYSKDFTLSAAYKYDERDNRTPVSTYVFYDAGETKSGTSVFTAYFPGLGLGGNANINANRPYSKRLNQVNLDADYRLGGGQAIKAGLDVQNINRYCDGSWIACVDANHSNEGTLRLEWRLTAVENFGARVGLSTSHRTVDYNENAFLAIVPAANWTPTGAPGGATAYGTLTALGYTGYGPVLGLNPLPATGSAAAFFFANNNALSNSLYGNQNRISELPGMRRFNMADRNRDKLRTALNWQASDTFALQAGLDLNSDRYGNSVYGLQSAKNWALSLDGTYTPSENTSMTVFYTYEDQRSVTAGNSYTANSTAANVNGFTAISGGCYATIALRNASNKIDPCLNWNADMRDKVNTLGLSFTRKNLAGGAVDMSGGLTFSQSRSDTGVNGGNYANNPLAVAGAAAGTIVAYYIPATGLPTVKNDVTELKLGMKYAFSKDTTLRLGYTWQHLNSTDWFYDGLQAGGLSGVLPTYEKAPTYNVHTIGVAYTFAFR